MKRYNWSIFPIVPGGKSPAISNGFKGATNDIKQIFEWWQSNPNYGIGLPTGKENNVIAIDIDPRNGGSVSFERLTDEYENLPHTIECLTGGGGSHLYYKYDERINKSKLDGYPGIDIQSNGKYIVLPPSIHPNGEKYSFELSSYPGETEIANMPDWLISLLSIQSNGTKQYKAKSVSEYLRILQGVSEGERNNSLMTLIGHLIARDIDYREAFELVHIWNETRVNPPLDEEIVTRAFNNVLNRELEKR